MDCFYLPRHPLRVLLSGMNKDRLVAIKSGGQSLTELTTFCRELARKGLTDEFSDDDQGGINLKLQELFS
jgi:hypothetical protein